MTRTENGINQSVRHFEQCGSSCAISLLRFFLAGALKLLAGGKRRIQAGQLRAIHRKRCVDLIQPLAILAGNRGFCNLNPWPGPSQLVPYRHQKRYSPY